MCRIIIFTLLLSSLFSCQHSFNNTFIGKWQVTKVTGLSEIDPTDYNTLEFYPKFYGISKNSDSTFFEFEWSLDDEKQILEIRGVEREKDYKQRYHIMSISDTSLVFKQKSSQIYLSKIK